MQITNTILMIRPVNFRMNEQTVINNYFQEELRLDDDMVSLKAQEEFDAFVALLSNHGINVIVIEDDTTTDTPDAVFPNNWISFHKNGDVVLYPVFAENRRLERREDVLDILEHRGFLVHNIIDYTSAEGDYLFLESTGSMILDRIHKKAYCALSPRANEALLIEFCEDFEYTPIIFNAYQSVGDKRLPIYHTNVMMCLAEDFAIVCLACVDDKKEQKNVMNHLRADGKEIIAITEDQVQDFAGNMIQVKGKDDQRYLVMSSAAYQSLTELQIVAIEKHCKILHSTLDTIEHCGGGSARCMMAEVFLPKKPDN